jgi:hypothetical protein
VREPNSRSPIVSGVTDVRTPDADSIADWAKKSSVSWIRFESGMYPVWHVWADDAICVVGSITGEIEQPLPPVHDGERAVVSLRSKAERALVAEVPVRVEILHPESAAWETITSVLKAGRQNSPDLATVVDRWAEECIVLRLVTDGEIVLPSDVDAERPRTLPRLS